MDWSGNLKQNQGLLALNRIELEDKKETKHDLIVDWKNAEIWQFWVCVFLFLFYFIDIGVSKFQ